MKPLTISVRNLRLALVLFLIVLTGIAAVLCGCDDEWVDICVPQTCSCPSGSTVTMTTTCYKVTKEWCDSNTKACADLQKPHANGACAGDVGLDDDWIKNHCPAPVLV